MVILWFVVNGAVVGDEFGRHREEGLWPSVGWKLSTGTSGTDLKALVVMPFLLMEVSRGRSTVVPSPCSTITTSGNFEVP